MKYNGYVAYYLKENLLFQQRGGDGMLGVVDLIEDDSASDSNAECIDRIVYDEQHCSCDCDRTPDCDSDTY